jgi:glycosyltransferase involved in cell wall biosynthesis
VKNLIDAPKILERAIKKFGIPDLLWCYNGYAYEMRTAKYALDKYGIKSILEFEDWHFARSSITNPKAVLDWLFWRRVAPSIGFAFAVNQFLRKKMAMYGVSTDLLPGVVSDGILNLIKICPPFRNSLLTEVKCGYFGGLSDEKGGTFLLGLIKATITKKLPLKWTITGSGELSSEFANIAEKYPLQVAFHGTVDDLMLQEMMGSVDVIVNPHLPNTGVFPFKVMEAVGSGRLVLSSELQVPDEMNWLLSSLLIVPLDLDTWIKQLMNAQHHYKNKYYDIQEAQAQIKASYSGAGLNNKLISAIHKTLQMHAPV